MKGDRRWDTLQGALIGALMGIVLEVLGVGHVAGLEEPLTLPLLACGVGGAVAWAGRMRPLAIGAAALVLLTALVGLVPWTPLIEGLVRADPLPDHPVGAVVVLSSGLSRDSVLDSGGVDRLLAGLELHRTGIASRLVTTRTVRHVGGVRVTSDVDQRRILALADVDSAWLVIDSVGVTRDEAVGSARLLLPLGVHEIIVVTQPSHTRRACGAFEKVGFVVHCHPARERSQRTHHAESSRQRFSVFAALVYETLGLAKYRWKGWA
jgi:uncharacterized SAM-binding protein YcdF (DUF218 family)